jgi:hypothetical protein
MTPPKKIKAEFQALLDDAGVLDDASTVLWSAGTVATGATTDAQSFSFAGGSVYGLYKTVQQTVAGLLSQGSTQMANAATALRTVEERYEDNENIDPELKKDWYV